MLVACETVVPLAGLGYGEEDEGGPSLSMNVPAEHAKKAEDVIATIAQVTEAEVITATPFGGLGR